MTELKKSPLDALHRKLGAKMVPFAGWDMPLSYPAGILKEHLHTREAASIFDVSHMAPMLIMPADGDMDAATAEVEKLVPIDLVGLAVGRQRYGFLTNDKGGIIDDLMIARREDHFYLVANAANADVVWTHLGENLPKAVMPGPLRDRALIALQGPQAGAVMERLAPESAEMKFLDLRRIEVCGVGCIVTRSGYTGEDGFEISIPAATAEEVARKLLAENEVEMAGLGARDSLRLEAGLCLHGQDIGPDTTPVEAGLGWAIQKVRRRGGAREGGFPGADVILAQLADGAPRKLVGLKPEGRAPVRAGAVLRASEDGEQIGEVTSGVFGPSVGGPVAMGYVAAEDSGEGTTLFAEVRGKALPVTVVKTPFVEPGYKR